MKYLLTHLVLSASALLTLAPDASASSSKQRTKDSLRLVVARTEGDERMQAREELASIYLSEVRREGALDTLLTIYDSLEADARRTGDAAREGIVRSNRLGAYYSKSLFDEVIDAAPATLEFLAGNDLWKLYYQSSMMRSDALRRKGALEQSLQEAERFYNHAKEREDRAGMGMAQLALSRTYAAQRRYEDSETCLRECIDLLQDQTTQLNYLATAYNNLATTLVGQQRYDEALETARATEAVNRRYEEASGTPQPSAWLNLWLTCTDICRQTERYDEAQRYVDRIDSITRGSVKMYKERGHILYGKKRYREALEMLDRAGEESPASLEVKGLKLMTLAQLREADRAVELFSEVIGEVDKRHNEAFASRLDEIRTQYEVDKYIAQKERNRNYFLFALGGCVLLTLLLGVAFYYNRVVTRKNIDLYKRIKEHDRLEEELAQQRTLAEHAQESAGETPAGLAGDRQQRELVDRLHDYLLRDRNLLQAELNRDELTSALGTNRNTLTDAVRAVTGKTPMEYIRTIRIEQARHLLDRHPELTVEAVAYDCGFNAPNTFYRLFRKQYGISPAEYRKIARSLEK